MPDRPARPDIAAACLNWSGPRATTPCYAKCVELDIPLMHQVGQSMIYAKDRPTHSVGRPITFDAVACDFPELKLIGMHVGIPWTDEMIAKAWKPLRDSAVQLFKLRI